MNIFEKLSNPIYFSKFAHRFALVIGIISLPLYSYLIYASISNNRQGLVYAWFVFILITVVNIIRSAKRLRKMRNSY